MNIQEIMYPANVKIDASRTDEEYWRVNRIHMIIGYAQALADNDNHPGFYKNINEIYDHKGTLTVTWNNAPSENEKEYLQKAWESIVTNYEGNPIEHIILP